MPGAVIISEQGVRSPCKAQMLITSSLHCQHPELKWSVSGEQYSEEVGNS